MAAALSSGPRPTGQRWAGTCHLGTRPLSTECDGPRALRSIEVVYRVLPHTHKKNVRR